MVLLVNLFLFKKCFQFYLVFLVQLKFRMEVKWMLEMLWLIEFYSSFSELFEDPLCCLNAAMLKNLAIFSFYKILT